MTAPHRPRARLRALIAAACTAVLGATLLTGTPTAFASENAVVVKAPAAATAPIPPPRSRVVGTYTGWSVYGRNVHIKDIQSSGTAARLTHIRYAHGYVRGDACAFGDSYADYDRTYSAAQSVDGVADSWEQPVRGNFNQLRKLKKLNPGLKVLWSFGGPLWSGNFGEASANAAVFARSCRALIEDPRWADVFDGIDIDWQYPNSCGLTCDTSGRESFEKLMSAIRAEFDNDLVSATITADAVPGGGIDAADYTGAARYVDWFNVMTYGLHGPRFTPGRTAPHAPLHAYPGIPNRYATAHAAIRKLKNLGITPDKLLLGISFEGHGWSGVTQGTPGATAGGPAQGTYEMGVDHYRVLKARCPATGRIGGTAYAHCGTEWWSYDTPDTVAGKVAYGKRQGLGGTFLWDLGGDTPDGELVKAIR
ncbi:glycoside hydrolase family 18 protein [Streptomyces albipurpureus]|uniref:chitinase n=1 Tax=Streptomyces albipurpureus TaxID=2897419 RepID=A0ABT0V2P2_9ACTN|nr:glycosyl hydrolase family 18 protein [Streptomyces sp. CWNU-1]MCM2393656.1 glycosyl hydrolase family 18 protein [Streptomyces sp. CWNU-1]